MADGFSVDPEQLRAHASHVAAVAARFAAVKAASAHIVQDDQAYGLLCGWISAILESRHVQQDELIERAQQNLALVVSELHQTADDYEIEDGDVATMIDTAGADA